MEQSDPWETAAHNGGEAPPQAWHRDAQTVHDDASNQLYHYNAAGQLPPPPPRYYSSCGMVRGQGQSFNMPLNNYAVYTQGGSSNHPVSQHQNYGPVSSYQQANYHGVTTNQAHYFLNPSRFQAAMQLAPNKANVEPQSQPAQLRPMLSGAGQGATDGDVEKDQRTLQFAASLLHQIKQTHQQPPLGTLAGHGP
ncbi:hypothetical protein Bca52824_003315 [Brassica carinata]|uniref:Uncharacterized protein n=1 Tax=Brassica carinata TaxID=52824 RepID=A0A8X7WMT7_BRACI|nr:hypothetical protein Bca52824_003315 [Brassica carinata]